MNCDEIIARRKFMVEKMVDGELLLLFSGVATRKSADEDYPFFTNRNFLYMTGIKQENCAVVISKKNDIVSETVFIDLPDEAREVWTGRRFRPEEIHQLSGIERVVSRDTLDKELHSMLTTGEYSALWLCLDRLQPFQAIDTEHSYSAKIASDYPYVAIKNCYPTLSFMRKLKSPAEVAAIRKAMAITHKGIVRMMQTAKPGMMEYQLEAEFNYELMQHGERSTAFSSIIAYGERNFYLHYPLPMGQLGADGLVLTDVGAPYDGYCTDISRVFPASGHFSNQQAEIYNLAHRASREIMCQIKPGKPFAQNNQICREIAFEGLKDLGIISDFGDIGKYVWHGVTHHVGLDTHDVGGYLGDMQENMVLTVDAGIYVRELGIGLRIEDNVLVTGNGCENLSAAIPSTIDEIESVMKGQAL